MPNLKIPKENVIGLAFEPVQFLGLSHTFIQYAQKHIGKYYIGDKNNLPDPFIEHFGYMWHSRPSKDITYKHSLMSIVLSNKQSAPGHKYRHELVKKIIELRLPIDIYGHGSKNYSYDRIKGSFNDAEPYENYSFSICIENYECNHYFSEKIITPILYNCMPIYVGCKNIDSYLDNVIKLSSNIDKDEFCKKHRQYYKFCPYLHDRPSEPWTEFSITNIGDKSDKKRFRLTRKSNRNRNNKTNRNKINKE